MFIFNINSLPLPSLVPRLSRGSLSFFACMNITCENSTFVCTNIQKNEKGEESLGTRVIAPYVCSSDLNRVDASDGVQEVVCFIDDDNVPLQLDPDGLTSWGMEEGIVGENYKLGERETVVNGGIKTKIVDIILLTLPEL